MPPASAGTTSTWPTPHEAWQEIKASWALEGIEVADDNAMQAGRMIAGDITYEQLVIDLHAKYGLS